MVGNKLSISIVIPNYNGANLIEKNLPKLILAINKSKNKAINEIILVDDASIDNSIKVIHAAIQEFGKQAKIILIKNDYNHGFSTTVNRGVKKATGDLVLLLNTDVYPEIGFLELLLVHFEDENVFSVGLMDKSREGKKTILRGRGVGWWQRGFYVHKKGTVDKTDTAWTSGGSMIVRRTLFNKLGGFDEIYDPSYWEDIDLSYRAVTDGYRLVFEPKSTVVHKHSTGAIKSSYSNDFIKKLAYRNQFLFVWKNATFAQFANHIIWMPYHLFKAVINRDRLFISGLFSAMARILSYKK